MRHLSLEDLARLVDEPPEPAEAAHLRDCLACRLELAEMRRDTEELAALPAPEPPAGLWDRIEAQLVDEGIVAGGAVDATPRRPDIVRRTVWLAPSLRAAAAVLLVLGGAALGWGFRGRTAAPASRPTAIGPVRVTPPSVARPADDASNPTVDTPQAAEGSQATLASNSADSRPAAAHLSPQAAQAERALRKAEADYAAALRRYAELADPASGADVATRLRALDGIVSSTRKALDRDPADPIANGYHLAAMEERSALVRQVAAQNDTTWY